jgi:hypothetical protein
MRSFTLATLSTAVFAVLAGGASTSPAKLGAAGAAYLDSLRESPESAGALIYRGAVFAQDVPAGVPLFTYERRVATMAGGLASAHITRDARGDVVIAEQAQHTLTYDLQRFDATNRQAGYSGTVVLSRGGRHLEFRLDENGKVTTAAEDVTDPVVAGPSLHGFILQHWQALERGETIPVRMIVMAGKRTYGFRIRRFAQGDGRTSFSVTPSHSLLRLALAPLVVTFDSATRNVVRYKGRVPPMRMKGGTLRTLDARVDYTMNVAAYR